MCNTTQVTPFRIVAKNEERGQPEASYVRSATIFLPGDNKVELQKSRRVLVRDTFRSCLNNNLCQLNSTVSTQLWDLVPKTKRCSVCPR